MSAPPLPPPPQVSHLKLLLPTYIQVAGINKRVVVLCNLIHI